MKFTLPPFFRRLLRIKETPVTPQQSEIPPAEKAKLDAEYKAEMEKLSSMQEKTSPEAHSIAQESLGVMMALGWIWDAALVVIKDDKGNVVRHESKLVIRPLKLGEWQAVQKEKIRHDLSGGKTESGIIT